MIFWYHKLTSDVKKSISDIRKSALNSYLAFHIPLSDDLNFTEILS